MKCKYCGKSTKHKSTCKVMLDMHLQRENEEKEKREKDEKEQEQREKAEFDITKACIDEITDLFGSDNSDNNDKSNDNNVDEMCIIAPSYWNHCQNVS